tara:strand:+ start:253 stop:567 length:315 start_codon:yes stop_codon:yes gene_type:complete
MAFKMAGFSAFTKKTNGNGNDDDKKKLEVHSQKSTSIMDDGDKYYTYDTTLYDASGKVVKNVVEEDLSKVYKTSDGYEYATLLHDVGNRKKGTKIYYSKPYKPK